MASSVVAHTADNLSAYRRSPSEKLREESLMDLIGSGESILEVGARDGHYTRLLQSRFKRVVALDIAPFNVPGAECVVGDVRALQFRDEAFDVVLCAEVLEHIPQLEQATRELARVTGRKLVVGVPNRQDLRVAKYTCGSCGSVRPAWGHVHSFSAARLAFLFGGLRAELAEFVGPRRPRTNAVSSWLMDRAKNPYGIYSESCHACGSVMRPPTRSIMSKICSRTAITLDAIQNEFIAGEPAWIHAVFTR